MGKPIMILFSLIMLSLVSRCDGSPLPAAAYGPHAVGYRTVMLQDAARSSGPRREIPGQQQPGPWFRSVPLHIWYPARESGGGPMAFREYLWKADGRDRGRQPSREEIIASYKAPPMARGADERELDAWLDHTTRARLDAAPAAGPFPLILYAPSINADPFENSELLEMLASHGYVVASAPCLGWDEPFNERNRLGALSQYSDLALVMNSVWREPFVDAGRVGVLGFSWGGMTSLLFALGQQGIGAVANLDGAQGMAAYGPVAESSPVWSPQRLRSPVLYICPSEEERSDGFFARTLYADTYIWKTRGLAHRDFAADLIASRRRAVHDPQTDQVESMYGRIAATLKRFFDGYLKGDRASLDGLSAPPHPRADWSARRALPPPPSASQFLAVIDGQGVEAAVALFRRLRRDDPALLVLEEPRLLEYATLWGPERSDELLQLLQINLEMYPRSVETRFWLAQVYMARDDRQAAIKTLDELLGLDPGHARANRLRQRLLEGDKPE